MSDETSRQNIDEQGQAKPRPQIVQPKPTQDINIQGQPKERPPTQKPTNQGK